MPDLVEPREVLVANLLATMRTFAIVRPQGEVIADQGMLCVYSGMQGAVFNAALLTEPLETEEELAVKLDYINAIYRARGARWSLWLIEHFLPDRLIGRVGRMVEPYGLTSLMRSAGMIADQFVMPRRVLPELEILPVYAPALRFDFCHVMAVAFRTPLATFLDVYHTEQYWDGPMRGFVGYSGGRAVGTACVLPAGGAIGVYGVATLPDVQRKGIGERMVRYAVGELERETGYQRTVLESSEMAASLYRRLGYHRITGVSIYNEER